MAIKSASITGKAVEVSASGSIDSTGEIIRFDGKLDVAKLDLNAYLPPPSEAEAAPVAEEDGAKGWSEEPIDVSPLRSAEGQVQITLANVLYREIEVRNAAATVSLSGGVLKADVTKVQLSPGDVTASAVVDGSSDAAGIDYRVALQGCRIEALPAILRGYGFSLRQAQNRGPRSGPRREPETDRRKPQRRRRLHLPVAMAGAFAVAPHSGLPWPVGSLPWNASGSPASHSGLCGGISA